MYCALFHGTPNDGWGDSTVFEWHDLRIGRADPCGPRTRHTPIHVAHSPRETSSSHAQGVPRNEGERRDSDWITNIGAQENVRFRNLVEKKCFERNVKL